jgi:hypothetical protein
MFNATGVCSNPAGEIYDPYTSKPDARNNASGRAPIPFDNLATYVIPGNPNIPFGLGNLPLTPGNLIDPVGAKLLNAFPSPNGTLEPPPTTPITTGWARVRARSAGNPSTSDWTSTSATKIR